MARSESIGTIDGISKFLLVSSKLLIFIRKRQNLTYTSEIYKKTTLTWSWINTVIRKLERTGFIEREKQGRIKIIRLTENGKEIADALIKIESILQNRK